MNHDPSIQASHDGPLTQEFVDRVRGMKKAKKLRIQDIAQAWGISVPWTQRIISEDADVRSRNKPATAQAALYASRLAEWEQEIATPSTGLGAYSTDALIAEIESRGKEVFVRNKAAA